MKNVPDIDGLFKETSTTFSWLFAGSAEGVCAAVAVRMQILLPLLPVVYADREAERAKNLRYQLARALLPILASPLVYGTFR